MTFYLLSRAFPTYAKKRKMRMSLVDLDHFIAQIGVSAELKEWMKKHRRIDLAGNDFIKELTAEDILDVPEFLSAYKSQNGAALHAVIPEPKYKSGDEQKNPEKYKHQREQYHQALVHYIQANLDSLAGTRCRTEGDRIQIRIGCAYKLNSSGITNSEPCNLRKPISGGHAPTDLNGRAFERASRPDSTGFPISILPRWQATFGCTGTSDNRCAGENRHVNCQI